MWKNYKKWKNLPAFLGTQILRMIRIQTDNGLLDQCGLSFATDAQIEMPAAFERDTDFTDDTDTNG
jgi:hypothetical protein